MKLRRFDGSTIASSRPKKLIRRGCSLKAAMGQILSFSSRRQLHRCLPEVQRLVLGLFEDLAIQIPDTRIFLIVIRLEGPSQHSEAAQRPVQLVYLNGMRSVGRRPLSGSWETYPFPAVHRHLPHELNVATPGDPRHQRQVQRAVTDS